MFTWLCCVKFKKGMFPQAAIINVTVQCKTNKQTNQEPGLGSSQHLHVESPVCVREPCWGAHLTPLKTPQDTLPDPAPRVPFSLTALGNKPLAGTSQPETLVLSNIPEEEGEGKRDSRQEWTQSCPNPRLGVDWALTPFLSCSSGLSLHFANHHSLSHILKCFPHGGR